MTRTITILLIALAVVAFAWASASTASAGYIDDLTLAEINGPKISDSFRSGVYTGIFLTITSSNALACPPMMSARMMVVGIETALTTKAITPDWRVYHAVLYALVQSGCTATEQEKSNA